MCKKKKKQKKSKKIGKIKMKNAVQRNRNIFVATATNRN